MTQKIRVGEISFANTIPLYHFYPRDSEREVFISHFPTGLNKSMEKGEVDVGPISSFSYAQNQDRYVLLPNLSISSYGCVQSIYLFSKAKQLKELDGKIVALTNTSATSVALLKVLLEKFYGICPAYVSCSPNLQKMLREADACLLIGDEAIRSFWSNTRYYTFDLGEEWYKYTQRSMTFAVWAARTEMVRSQLADLQHVYECFLHSRTESKVHAGTIIHEAQSRLGGSFTFWSHYFRGLNYGLDEKEQVGLEIFYKYAFELGLLKEPVELNFMSLTDKGGEVLL